eukprot:154305_1
MADSKKIYFVEIYACDSRFECTRCHTIIKAYELQIENRKHSDQRDPYHVACFTKYLSRKHVWPGKYRFRVRCKLSGHNKKVFKEMISYFNSKRAKLRLKKHIYEMTNKELKDELFKRELLKKGNKLEMQQRLRKYLETDLCVKYQKRDNEKLITSYFRQKEKKYKLNVPAYVQK